MNKPNSSAEQQEVKRTIPQVDVKRYHYGSASSVMSYLFNRVKSSEWTADELEFLSHSAETASHMAGNLAEVVSGVGCLVSWDDQPGKSQAGNFRAGDDVSALLFTISEQIATIGELANIGSEAGFLLGQLGAAHV
jgi:hypothetical protein